MRGINPAAPVEAARGSAKQERVAGALLIVDQYGSLVWLAARGVLGLTRILECPVGIRYQQIPSTWRDLSHHVAEDGRVRARHEALAQGSDILAERRVASVCAD